MTVRRSWRAALLVVLGCHVLAAEAANLYRYRDANGVLVIASSIPNDRVPLGYDVLAGNGRLLKTVAPQLTAEEAAIKAEWERRLKLCTEAQRRVQSMYASLADIDAAEEQAQASIDTQIENLKANLLQSQKNLSELEEDAARRERAGGSVPAVIIANIDRARAQIQSLEEQIESRKAEKVKVRRQYDRERKVFTMPDCEEAASDSLFDEVAEG